MFGKRANPGLRRPRPPDTRRRGGRGVRAAASRSTAPSRRRVQTERRVGKLFSDQVADLRRADRGDRSRGAVQARSRQRARGNSRHRPRDRHDQESGAVDRRAGGSARRHLQRRARLRPARAAAGARRHRRHHGQRSDALLHRSRRQDPTHQRPLPRQRAVDEHLPAHRQPGRPPRRRSLADLRRAPARRLARQRHRAAAGDRRRRADDPQVQEGQADARPTGAASARSRRPAPKFSRSSAASAATSSFPAAPARARRRCSTA